jgi:S-DNA-T family DNA segregation ATPase FtsK/SpoIIIE
MAAARHRAKKRSPPPRARRSLMSRIPSLSVRAARLSPHQVDVAALALIAVGVFLAGVAYLHWPGGALGDGAVRACRLALGQLGYAVPAALIVAGALVLARELRAPIRPLRTGSVLLVAALSLGLAAGTLGVGPGRTPARSFWRAGAFARRGGVLGQLELWLASHLLSYTGADILAVFLTLAGLILLSGATISSAIRATGRGVGRTGRTLQRARTRTGALVARSREQGSDARAQQAWEREPLDLPDGDPQTAELVVRATHVEAPANAPPLGDQPAETLGDRQEELGDQDDQEPAGGERRVAQTVARGLGDGGAEGDLTPQGRYRAAVSEDPAFVWRVPSPRLLTRSTGEAARPDTAGQEQVAATLIETLGHFGVQARVVGRVTGPHITRYELRLAPGTKVAKVSQLKDDLAYALAATEIRILAPIPGKTAVGVEVPNARRRIVHLGDVFQQPPEDWSPLTVWLGKDIAGRAIGADLAKMPHLLVAGTTGAGKSAAINSMLCSILLRATPHQARMVLVDPKQVELNHYESIPHLLTPVITSPRMAANALGNLVREMEQRYAVMSLARTRSLPELNRVRERRGEPPLPYILCVIDELADLMMVAPADVEDAIIRLAQKARAVGIHLVLATQSPRVDVITGMIKANVPSRIAFAVSSQTDSRVILDQNGAESLLGQGDMLFSPVGSSRLQRIQGAWIDEAQIAALTEFWRRQGEPELREELLEEVQGAEEERADGEEELDPDEDPLLEDAIALVAQMGTASTSMLQRRLRLGYTRAGRLIDMLERRGIISGYEGSKPRQVLIGEADVPRIIAQLAESRPGLAASGADGARRRTPPGGPSAADSPDGRTDAPSALEHNSF